VQIGIVGVLAGHEPDKHLGVFLEPADKTDHGLVGRNLPRFPGSAFFFRRVGQELTGGNPEVYKLHLAGGKPVIVLQHAVHGHGRRMALVGQVEDDPLENPA
jgi:hypothetical protein